MAAQTSLFPVVSAACMFSKMTTPVSSTGKQSNRVPDKPWIFSLACTLRTNWKAWVQLLFASSANVSSASVLAPWPRFLVSSVPPLKHVTASCPRCGGRAVKRSNMPHQQGRGAGQGGQEMRGRQKQTFKKNSVRNDNSGLVQPRLTFRPKPRAQHR